MTIRQRIAPFADLRVTMPRMERPTTWFTYASPDIWLGEFRLAVDHPGWKLPNNISERAPLIAFPGTTVRITQQSRPSVVADPTRAVLYAAGQPYRRDALSADGDRCSFVTFSHELAAEAAAPFDSAAADPSTYRFPFVCAPIESDVYTLQQAIRSRARGGDDADELREQMYWVVGSVVAAGYREDAVSRRNVGAGVAAASQRHEIADAVRGLVGADLSVSQSLEEIGAAVGYSPFHLARTFREVTGYSIHSYRTHVRLRASLAPLADGERLAEVAAAVGFSSQAHFTDRFREVFGVTPHAWRLSLTGRSPNNRTNLESMEALSRLA